MKKNQSKTEIRKAISDLLDQQDCVVRIQRELVPDPAAKHDAAFGSFKTSDKLTVIIVATTKAKETT